jgi:hypothetical protein
VIPCPASSLSYGASCACSVSSEISILCVDGAAGGLFGAADGALGFRCGTSRRVVGAVCSMFVQSDGWWGKLGRWSFGANINPLNLTQIIPICTIYGGNLDQKAALNIETWK